MFMESLECLDQNIKSEWNTWYVRIYVDIDSEEYVNQICICRIYGSMLW